MRRALAGKPARSETDRARRWNPAGYNEPMRVRNVDAHVTGSAGAHLTGRVRPSVAYSKGHRLDVGLEVVKTLQETLNLGGPRLTAASPLLGAVPELDSMAVVTVITTLEERFGFTVADDEIDGSIFATVGSLVEFVESKLAA